ncbi:MULTISPECIES: histidine phosphatase family protein [Paenibacillus]|uniref:histidine phosphatase family protein n=1 Tax=Paenibacillus TaxID=44249 RepID=UPI00096D744C|nr:histidine phosphatase family protein [Paenibacillus odorifer]OMC95074.1 histidine phosphatase family protein [Paenibacillus odorifer]
MTKTVLYLTRHGQTEWNLQKRMQGHQNSALTALGEQQTEWLRDRLQVENLGAIYSSTSPRALHTAQILRGKRSLPIQQQVSLMEINMGSWEGMNTDQIQLESPLQYSHFFTRPDLYIPLTSGETYKQLEERVVPTMERIINDNVGLEVLIVTHRMTLKVIMAYFLNKSLQEIGELPDILSTALCKVTLTDNNTTIDLYGDTSHYQ